MFAQRGESLPLPLIFALGNREITHIRFPHGGRARWHHVRVMLNRSSSPRENIKQTDKRKAESMNRFLLAALAISGLAFVPFQRAYAQPTVLVPRTEGISFGFPAGYSGSPTYLNYYPYGYYRHPYVHYYPYAGNPYSYYSAAPSSLRHAGHRSYHHHRTHHSY
jgi:hypothetical protein